ncbi:serine--tRNA ligase, mitochondrial-like [Pomacea canaliculata]|uniref:serine--tRNA ligase, mitochondrial-like n=1 Tax=Pomacea canaliculata TaxID=400727 RepID=UPI000D72F29B|nr:serine--tRNA ligase, mitochondrial-like [Pomacea canaliculata]
MKKKDLFLIQIDFNCLSHSLRGVCSLCHQCHQVSSPLLKRTLSTLSREESDWKDKEKSSECSSDLDSRERKSTRKESPWRQPIAWEEHMQFPGPQLNWEYLCNPDNTDIIQANISNRKGVGDIHRVHQLWKEHKKSRKKSLNIPNLSHPASPLGEEANAKLVEKHGQQREFNFKPKTVVELGEALQLLKTSDVGMTTGPRTYYFIGALAELEQALVNFTLHKLLKQGFKLVSVPDLLYPNVIDRCGFKTEGERTQVYKLPVETYGLACLAGTAEMSLAGLFLNEVLNGRDLPMKLTAVSRCYRAETSDIAEEKGIYRVHQFTKVEMFGVTANCNDESEQLHQLLLDVEKDLFLSLGLHFRILDMPTEELGAPAYRKFDVETWMPGSGKWGEISSTSNCTDFQSRRLNICYLDSVGGLQFAHTVNGTACAVPRMVMALLENNQQQNGSVVLPEVLKPYMNSGNILCPPGHQKRFTRISGRKSS